MGIAHAIELIGVVDDPVDILRSFDVLAVTSWEETFSLAALECMALGKPVLCFRNGGTPELIGDAGIVVNNYRPDLMADEIVALAEDKDRYEQLAQASVLRAAENYTEERVLPRFTALIAQVAGTHRA